jgi:hypothetical protein
MKIGNGVSLQGWPSLMKLSPGGTSIFFSAGPQVLGQTAHILNIFAYALSFQLDCSLSQSRIQGFKNKSSKYKKSYVML